MDKKLLFVPNLPSLHVLNGLNADCRAPGIRVESFHSGTKREREKALSKIHRHGGVVLTSYGMMVNPVNTKQLSERAGREFEWVC